MDGMDENIVFCYLPVSILIILLLLGIALKTLKTHKEYQKSKIWKKMKAFQYTQTYQIGKNILIWLLVFVLILLFCLATAEDEGSAIYNSLCLGFFIVGTVVYVLRQAVTNWKSGK